MQHKMQYIHREDWPCTIFKVERETVVFSVPAHFSVT